MFRKWILTAHCVLCPKIWNCRSYMLWCTKIKSPWWKWWINKMTLPAFVFNSASLKLNTIEGASKQGRLVRVVLVTSNDVLTLSRFLHHSLWHPSQLPLKLASLSELTDCFNGLASWKWDLCHVLQLDVILLFYSFLFMWPSKSGIISI